MIFLLVVVICAAIVLMGAAYQKIGAARDRNDFPPPGQLISIGHGKLHVNRTGQGSPAVIFEAGMASTSLAWSLVQPQIARIAATASYDRFGLGWSDPVSGSREIRLVVAEMHAMLHQAGVATPRILVGHSYGGLIVRAYAACHPGDVAGLVLVDPVAAGEWFEPDPAHRRMLRRGIMVSRFCGLLVRLGGVRFLMNHWNLVSGLVPKRTKNGNSAARSGGLDRIVGEVKKLPREIWPMVQSHWCNPKCFDGMARYFAAFPSSAAAVARNSPENGAVHSIPLIVLSAGNASAIQRAEHEALVRQASFGRLEIVSDSGHWLHFDRPDTVIRAIEEMVNLCRDHREIGEKRN